MVDGLPVTTPRLAGMDELALAAMIEDCRAHGQDLHSLTLCCDGEVALEAVWWPYRGRPQVMHSIAKSFTSAAIGLALEEGILSLTDKVVDFFPEYLPHEVSENLAAMTVEDLLTMRCGHASEISGSVWRRITTSWVAEFFKVPVVHPPGTVYVYTSAASYMLSAIITKVSGELLHDYLRPRLFAPLGIEGERWDIGTDGINPGGNGLTCKPADLLKLGLLYAQKGLWQGQRILSEAWVARSVSPHSRYGDDGLGYGYHWHTGPDGEFYATGLFGQLIAVFPRWDLVLVITSATPGPMPCLGQIVPLLRTHLPDVMKAGAADPKLAQLQKEVSLPVPLISKGRGVPGMREYGVKENPLGISRIRLEVTEGRCSMRMTSGDGEHAIVMGMDSWIEGVTTMPGHDLHHGYALSPARVVAGARWAEDNVLEMRWLFVETVFRDSVICAFEGNRVTILRGVNVNSGDLRWPVLEGVLDTVSAGRMRV